MNVSIWRDGDAWDAFVQRTSCAASYHRWAWKAAIEKTYGHPAQYLAATEGDRIRGVLPLFRIDSALFGRSIVSLPFFSYGGLLADSEDPTTALLGAAAGLAAEQKARYVELRHNDDRDIGWRSACTKVRLEIPLPKTVDELWKRVGTGLRNKIRKGQKSDLRVEWCGFEGIGAFYEVFATNMRNLGTPVYPRRWFEELFRASPERIQVLNVWSGARAVAAAFLVPHGPMLELPWSASLMESRKQYSHVFLYWTFLEWAIRNGFQRMDLGRCTPGGGTYEFKRHWVCDEKPMHWQYWLRSGAAVPNTGASNRRFSLAVKAWKHLPVAVANRLGPHIVRALP